MDQLTLETLKIAVGEFSKTLFGELKPLLKEGKAEILQFLNDGVSAYLTKQQKYAFLKTLLHRTEPVFIYDIYQPLKLGRGEETITTDSVTSLLDDRNYLTIIGEAGSGKSVLVKHLFLNCIKEKAGIPMLVELRDLNSLEKGLEEYIKDKLFENKIAQSDRILERLLERGRFIFFFDGYDEIKAVNKDKVISNLNAFIGKYDQNKFLLTSRPYTNIELMPLFSNYEVQKLKAKEIDQFVRKQVSESELVEKILKSIKEGKAKFIKSFLTNPLLLSLYILTFRSYSTIPDKKYLFYRRVIDVLFSEHDSLSKLGYERERCSNLTQEQFEEVLMRFSFLTFFEGLYDFEKDRLNGILRQIKEKTVDMEFENGDFITDLKVGTALWVEDAGVMSFSHRSLQEYFAALYIKDLKSDQKKEVYGKVYAKVLAGKMHEVENFLSLCEEMDQANYITHLAIPVLEDYLKYICKGTVEETIKAILVMIFGKVLLGYNRREISSGRSNRRFSLQGVISGERGNFFLTFDPECREFLFGPKFDVIEVFNNRAIGDHIARRDFHDDIGISADRQALRKERYYTIDLENSLDNEFLRVIVRETDFCKKANGLVELLTKRISDLKAIIAKRDRADEELIKLI